MIDKRAVAIDHFSNIVNHDAYEDAFKDSCKIAIEALGKQIPKKPVVYTDTRNLLDYYGNSCGTYEVNVFECPACGEYITDVDEPCLYAYCGECGQALDWSADNG